MSRDKTARRPAPRVDVGVADRLSQPIHRRRGGAFAFQHVQHVGDLRAAAIDPGLRRRLVQQAFVEQADRLVG